jgi:two-component system sensor histidine kinase/response regulator
MDGFSLARAIKADPLIASTKLVVLSSLAHQISAVEVEKAGIESSLTKPIKQSHLFECLRAIVGTSAAPKRAAAQTVQSPGVVPANSGSQPSKARILLAEDNAINQKVALSQLQEIGYQADVAVNGLEVLKALQHLPYDIVLMDCQMPEMDGYETTRQIRKVEGGGLSISSHRPIHIIAMTAHVMEGDREKCLQAGMDDYISKPVHSDELRKVLERWERLAGEQKATSVPEPTDSKELKGSVPSGEDMVVDVNRFLKVSSNRAKQMRELANLYLAQAADLLRGLDLALQEGSAQEVEELAHKLAGSSASCGMAAILPALRALERVAQEGELAGAKELYAEAVRQFDRIESFLKNFLESV